MAKPKIAKLPTRTRAEALALVNDYATTLADADINFLLKHRRNFCFEFTVNGDCDFARHLLPEFEMNLTTSQQSRFATLTIRYYERPKT